MKRLTWIVAGVLLGAGLMGACGKSSEQKADGAPAGALADSAASSGVAGALAARGFVVVDGRPAPAQRAGHTASLVTYRNAGGTGGGVVYVQRAIDHPDETIGWHWYFSDAAPDSAAFTEINRDGLWDARVYFGGRAVDMIQGSSFSLLGRGRGGSEAMNGASSAPGDLWKCFDGDTTTAWRAPAGGAYIEVPLPLGVRGAELDVQLAQRNRPRALEVYVGDRKLQTIDLAGGSTRQSFRLEPAARDADAIRIEIEGAGEDSVAISELEIR